MNNYSQTLTPIPSPTNIVSRAPAILPTRKGFTLIELLIAISIFSIMAVVASTVLFTVFNAREQTTEHAIQTSELQIAFVLIERDLTQIVNRAIQTSTTLENAVTGGQDKLTFSRGGIINPLFKNARSTLSRIEYSLKDRSLIRSSTFLADKISNPVAKEEVLLKQVNSLTFQFIDKNGQPQPQWYDKNLPKAIRVTLTHKKWGKISQIYALNQYLVLHAKIEK